MDTHGRQLGRKWILYLVGLLSIQFCAYVLLIVPSCLSTSGAATLLSDAPVIISNATSNNNNGPYALAKSQSFGFFYDITEEQWNLHRQIYRNHSNHLNPKRPLMYNPQNDDKKGIETWGDPEVYSSYKAWYQSVS